jgi:long-chain acyl-CoA synthetase
MRTTFFTDRYPKEVPKSLNLSEYSTVIDVFKQSTERFANRPAFTALGKTLTYAELDRLSAQFAAYLQHYTGLKPGDRIAVQLPNLLQYPVAVFGAMRAGLIVVNTNPLYTEREMQHQFKDSGAKALVILANFAYKVPGILKNTAIEKVIVTEVGDLCSPLKGWIVNAVVKYVRKEVPSYQIQSKISLKQALQLGASSTFEPVERTADDVCVLQYTGGTTGIAKGAMLTHTNLVANMLQARPYFEMCLGKKEDSQESKVVLAPLPLYHIYAFTVNCMIIMETGNHNVLIPNPRDIKAFVNEAAKWKFNGFLGLNTLFVALCKNVDFQSKVDFSRLKLTISGGMALTHAAADLWKKVTGCDINEGYGMTETSPIVCFNPPGYGQLGTIGLPVPDTLCKVIDEQGVELNVGEPGELCVKGPQVMKGYWNRPEATAEVFDEEGWFKTGDMAVIQEDGYVRIVDRKKDMIIVSGFNVYPNEIEDVIASHPAVVECAAVGVSNEDSGEMVKLYVVSSDPAVTETDIRNWAKERLTAYKVPKQVIFRDELPKTNVGKILRRELREETVVQAK